MTVYLVQDTKTVDPKTGQLHSKFDFAAAEQFGEIVELLDPGDSPFKLEQAKQKLRKGLAMFTDEDYLLLVGSPVLIGLAVAVAADNNAGDVNMLQWSGAKRLYIPVKAQNIFGDCAPGMEDAKEEKARKGNDPRE